MAKQFKIAVVIDDRNLAENIRDILEPASDEISVVNNGKEAFALFSKIEFDLAVVDVKLSDTTGQELVKLLSAMVPGTEYILITDNVSLKSAIASVKIPKVIGYEIKPVNMHRLRSFVQQVVRRRQAQKEARKNRTALETLISNLPGMAYRCRNTPEWTMEFVSEGCEKLTGYKSHELINNHLVSYGDLIRESHRPMVWEGVQRALGVRDHFEIRYPIVDKAGQTRWVWEKGIGVVSDDASAAITHIDGFVMDITKEKNMEAQLQQAYKMEAIGTLSGGIAHDFNNILGIILGNMELAMDDVPDWNPARLNLEEIKTATFRAKDVVRQLLSFSRKTEVNKKSIKINELVRESVALLRASIPSTIDIQVQLSETVPSIHADATQIQQIILNLSTNAVHAIDNDRGGLSITLDTLYLARKGLQSQFKDVPPGEYVRLTVEDNGQGIDPAIMEKIFDPYFTTKAVGKGTGLGLSVVHGIVNNHDGAIFIDSTPGKGTVAQVIFPAVPHADDVDASIKDTVTGGNEHILFVDDEPSLLKMAQQLLKRLGYVVTIQRHPQKALALFEKTPQAFDLVITDMTMPDLRGDRLAKALLDIRPDLPIILCTGFTESINALKARHIGIHSLIGKPLDRRRLAVAVRDALEGSHAFSGKKKDR